jgi:tyrosyl-tRNA synthetase
MVHGEEEYRKALETTEKLFTQQSAPAESLSVEDLESIQGIEKKDYERSKLAAGIDVVSFMSETGIFPSKGEARKMIQNGGVSINRHKVPDVAFTVNDSQLLHNQYLLIQKGKKNYYLVQVQ